MALLAAVLALIVWWKHGLREELILILQPAYRVTEIDSSNRLMTVEGVSEAYVVHCRDLCNSFVVGGKYSMLYRGSTLEYRRDGRRFEMEIQEIRTKPAAVPGGMG